jgi:hypothetical protein
VFVIDAVNQAALVRGSSTGPGTSSRTARCGSAAHPRPDDRPVAAAWTFVKTAQGELSFDHRLYTVAEYGELLQRAGFGTRRVFGGVDGGELTMDTFRFQIVARKG